MSTPTETMAKVIADADKNLPKSAAPKGGIPVVWLLFVDALDFPGVQESNVRCVTGTPDGGRQYTCWYLPELSSFMLRMYSGSELQRQRMIPRERVKQWEMA